MYWLLGLRRVLRPCEHCGTKFRPGPADVGRFCRTECWYEWRRAKSIKCGVCAHCKKTYPLNGKRLCGDGRKQFCSTECKNAALEKPRAVAPPAPDERSRWVPLTCGKFALVDADLFDAIVERPWTYSPKHAPSHGRNNGTPRQLHHFVMGVEDSVTVDHRDGNTLDNRRGNFACSDGYSKFAQRAKEK